MFYLATLRRSGKSWLVTFADCEGCLTQGRTRAEAVYEAGKALDGWLEAHLQQGNVPPKPRARRGDAIAVAPRLSVAIQLRWRREDVDLTQSALARLAGVSQQQIAKLEDPAGNPTIETLEDIATVLGMRLTLSFEPVP